MEWGIAVTGLCSTALGIAGVWAIRQRLPKLGEIPPENFAPAFRFDRADKRLTLLLDPRSLQFAIAAKGHPRQVYSIDQIRLIAVERNGVRLNASRRGNGMKIAEAAVRGPAAPVRNVFAAILGGEPVSRLAITILTDEPRAAEHEIVFFASSQGVSTNNHDLMLAAMELDEWFGRFQGQRAVHDSQADPNCTRTEIIAFGG